MTSVKIFLVVMVCTFFDASYPQLLKSQYSQNRGYNIQAYRHGRMICEDSLQMFQLRTPYLSQIPPLSVSMPLDVLIAYIAADSISKTLSGRGFDSLLNSIQSFNDTLRYFGKYYYNVIDYDPIRFNQYIIETVMNSYGFTTDNLHFADSAGNKVDTLPGSTNGMYRLPPIDIRATRLISKYITMMPDSLPNRAVNSLLASDYILRISVDSVDSCINYLSTDPDDKRYAVYATVLDTIKGMYFPDLCSQNDSYLHPFRYTRQADKDQPRLLNEVRPCNRVRFEYWKGAYWTGDYLRPGISFIRDTAFLDSDNHFKLSPGSECIVFLELSNHLLDDNYDYYNLDLNTSLSYGLLRISDGKVVDPNKVWFEQSLPVELFNFRIQNLIYFITHP